MLNLDDNNLLGALFGEFNQNLAVIEDRLDVRLYARGNQLAIEGEPDAIDRAREVVLDLYGQLERGGDVSAGAVDGAIRMAGGRVPVTSPPRRRGDGESQRGRPQIAVRKRLITARSPGQATYIRRLQDTPLVFALGPAGTGKTYLAVAHAVAMLVEGAVDRIILSRPAVEAGENLGFLPGDMREKVDPYLRPLYDALHDLMPAEQVERRFRHGEIEIAPLAFMRGRTLSNACVILDEAQNTTPMQMKMFLTRFGEGAHMVAAGDPSQIDLPANTQSGLKHAVRILADVEGIAIVKLGANDVVRHPLVGRMIEAYEAVEAK